MTPRLAELFERAADGDLDGAEDAQLGELLADAESRSAVIEQRRIALLVAACWTERSSATTGALARTAATAQRPSRIHLRIRSRTAGRRWLGVTGSAGRMVAAAAVLMVAILGGRLLLERPQDLPVVAGGRVQTTGGSVITTGQLVATDAVVVSEVGSPARLLWRDGTRVEFSGAGTLAVADHKQLRLDQGTIQCRVAPQLASLPLRVRTTQAETQVVGTEFTVTTDDQVTRLAVTSGTVLFTDLGNRDSTRVTAGGRAAAGVPATSPALARGISVLLVDITGAAWQPDPRSLRQLDAIASAGFSFVRIVIPGKRAAITDDSSREMLAVLDGLMNAILTRGLAIMVSPYPLEDVDAEGARRDQERLWPALATHLAHRPAERVFFELCNDPRLPTAQRSAQVAQLVDAIRRSAPESTLVIDTHMGLHGSTEALETVVPLSENRLIYAVRFFDPILFTHQGGEWVGAPASQVTGVPYPSDPASVARAEARTPAAREAVDRYGAEHWNSARIDALLASAAGWGERNHASVLVANFAAMTSAPPGDRAAWMRDVRIACERHHLGWALWQDTGAFSLWTGPTRDALTRETLQALGLQNPGR